MTHQELNHYYYLYTNDKKGIGQYQRITTTGDEMRNFIEFILKRIQLEKSSAQYELDFNRSPNRS